VTSVTPAVHESSAAAASTTVRSVN
jgi:hypothetical protein